LFRTQSKAKQSIDLSKEQQVWAGQFTHGDASQESRIPAHSSAPSKKPVWKAIAGSCESNQ
jgi:hypothetical protein